MSQNRHFAIFREDNTRSGGVAPAADTLVFRVVRSLREQKNSHWLTAPLGNLAVASCQSKGIL